MALLELLGIERGLVVAVVGAGGKTSTVYRCADEAAALGWNVVVCTTTKMYLPSLDQADLTVIEPDLETAIALAAAAFRSGQRRVLVAPGIVEAKGERKIDSVAPSWPHRLLEQSGADLVLVEADGAAHRPLKAPRPGEPVYPDNTDRVAIVAGLDAIGGPFGPDLVFRHELAGPLMGLQPGQPITPLAVVRLLSNAAGGLRDFPESAEPVFLLNKADALGDPSAIGTIARLLSGVDVVIWGRGIEPWVYPRIGSIILAAGSSSRLGQPKQLVRFQGETLVRRAALLALATALHPVILVAGAQAEAVLAEVEDLVAEGLLTTVVNRDYEQGQSTSLHAGLALLPNWVDGVVMQLVDQPYLQASDLALLADRFADGRPPAVVPTVAGKRSSPVLFRADQFPALRAVSGDQGGRGVLRDLGGSVVEVPLPDPRAAIDIDTPEALQEIEGSL